MVQIQLAIYKDLRVSFPHDVGIPNVNANSRILEGLLRKSQPDMEVELPDLQQHPEG